MLDLPNTFSFSQSSLQAFDSCARRFWLAYVQQLPWPAVEAAPVQDHEVLMRLGSNFHQLIERAEVGIDKEQMAAGLHPPLSEWFDSYQQHRPADLPADYIEVEKVLSIPFGSSDGIDEATYRLAAKYDLIAASNANDDRAVMIVDWKTTRKRTDPATLKARWQTMVYPYVLVEASAKLPFGPIEPEQVEMLYWFTAAPEHPVRFRYDSAQHASNRMKLEQLLARLLMGETEDEFPKVADTPINRRRFCNYCVYRSRCDRGQSAGDVDELDEPEELFIVEPDTALEFTLDDVEELAF